MCGTYLIRQESRRKISFTIFNRGFRVKRRKWMKKKSLLANLNGTEKSFHNLLLCTRKEVIQTEPVKQLPPTLLRKEEKRSRSYLWMIAQLFESCYVGQNLWLLQFFSNCPLNLWFRTWIYQFGFDNLVSINSQQSKTPYIWKKKWLNKKWTLHFWIV